MIDDVTIDDPFDVAAPKPQSRRAVRGMDKLNGVRPELIDHFNKLDALFQQAGITPEIKAGFRTTAQQQSLYNNPATRARTKGNDGINRISPHQRGEALDIGFNTSQRAKGRSIIADYARQNGLQVPGDEPWHVGLRLGSRQSDDPFDAVSQSPSSSQGNGDDDPFDVARPPQQTKQPKVTVSLSEGAEMASPEEIAASKRKVTDATPPIQGVQPVQFQQGTGLRAPEGVVDYRLTSQEARAPRNASEEPGQGIRLPFDPNKTPSQDDIERAMIRSLGSQYETLNEQYRKDTLERYGKAENLVQFPRESWASLKREPDGSVIVGASQGAIDHINAYAKNGLVGVEALQKPGAHAFEARTPSTMDKLSEIGSDVRQYLNIDTPAGLKSDFPRGVAHAVTLGAIGEPREITPEEKLINPQAEATASLSRGAGEAAGALLPFVAAGKILAPLELAKPVQTAAQFGLVDAGKQLVNAARGRKVDWSSPVVSAGVGAVIGQLEGRDPGVIRKVVAFVSPQLALDAAQGVPQEQAIKNALTNMAFALGTGNERAEPNVRTNEVQANEVLGIQRAQTVPDFDAEIAARENRVAPPTNPEEVDQQIRHVDLQRRLDDGTFGKETRAESEARRAQVGSAQSSEDDPFIAATQPTTAQPAENLQSKAATTPAPDVSASAATRPPVEGDAAKPIPDWVRQDIESKVKQANSLGIADEIESLSAERLTADQVARRIKETRLPGGTVPTIRELVRAVRADRGIPSMDNKTEFESWLQSRAASPPPVEPTARLQEPEEPSPFNWHTRNRDGQWAIVDPSGKEVSRVADQQVAEQIVDEMRNQPAEAPGMSLSQAVRAAGGIRFDTDQVNRGEVSRLSNKETQSSGLVNNQSGSSLQSMAEEMASQGYGIGDWAEQGARLGGEGKYRARPEVDMWKFLDAVEQDVSGNKKSYSTADQDNAQLERKLVAEMQSTQDDHDVNEWVTLLENEQTGGIYDKIISGEASQSEANQFRQAAYDNGISPEFVDKQLAPQALASARESMGQEFSEPTTAGAGERPASESNNVAEPDFVRRARERLAQREQHLAQGGEYRASGGPDTQHLIDQLIVHGYELYAAQRPKFEEWARQMRQKFGDAINEHLQSVYAMIRGDVPESETTSARKTQLAADRAELVNLPDLTEAERKGWETSLDNAKTKGLDTRASALADEVLRKPRAFDDEETAGLVLRLQDIKNQHRQLLNEIGQSENTGDISRKADQLYALEDEFDKLTQATKLSGTEKGRSLAAQKLTINRDYDLASLLNRYKAAVERLLTTNERAELERISKRLNGDPKAPAGTMERMGLEKAYEQAQGDLVSQTAKKIIREQQAELRRSQRRASKETLAAEAAVIKSNIAAEFKRLSARQSSTTSLWGLGNLDPDGVITRELARYVRNRVKAGVTDAAQIVDDAHAMLKEFAENVTRRQVEEAIAGYGKPVERKSDLERTIIGLRAQMKHELAQADVEAGTRTATRQGPRLREGFRQTEGPRLSEGQGSKEGPRLSEATAKKEGPQLGSSQGPRMSEARKLPAEGPSLGDRQGPRPTRKAIETRYQKMIDEYQRRIDEGDFSEKPQRGRTVLDDRTRRLKLEAERTKRQYDAMEFKARQRAEWDKRNLFNKGTAYMAAGARAGVLSGVKTIGKIGSALAQRVAQQYPEELAAKIAGKMHPETAEKADRYGGHLNVETEKAAARGFGRGVKEIPRILKSGETSLTEKFGDYHQGIPTRVGKALEVPGRVHFAEKNPLLSAEYERSKEALLQKADRLRPGSRNDPDVIDAAEREAYDNGKEVILMGKNPISDAFQRMVRGFSKTSQDLTRTIVPVNRVAGNYLTQMIRDYGTGLIRGTVRAVMERNPERMRNLSNAEAEKTMRMIQRGAVGAIYIALAGTPLGAALGIKFGGFYQKGRKDDVKAADIKWGKVTIPHQLLHSPPDELAQLAASMNQEWARRKDIGKGRAVMSGAARSVRGVEEQTPFVNELTQFKESLEGDKQLTNYLGRFVASRIEPGALRDAAGLDTAKRKPQGFTDQLKMGVPGLRQTVPISDVFGAKQTKASDEVQRLEIDLRGAQRQPDETAERFHMRQSAENNAIRRQIEAIVNTPEYDKVSDDDRREWIKQAREFAVKQVQDQLPEKPEKPEKKEFPMPNPFKTPKQRSSLDMFKDRVRGNASYAI